jgi:hypothetical protein
MTVALSTAALGAAFVVSAPAATATAAVSHPATASAASYGSTWTADAAGNSITEYAPSATGAATPVATISGPDTGLSGPAGVAVGPTGTVYVVNTLANSITAYDSGSNGDAAPSATISGPSTGLDAPSSISLGSGQLWVTDPASNLVEAFDAGANADALPAETIHGWRTKLHHPTAVAVDNELGEVDVLNLPPSGPPSLATYFAAVPARFGNIAPIGQATGGPGTALVAPTGVAVDGLGGVAWVTDASTHSVSAVFITGGPGPGIVVLSRIKGSATGLVNPTGVTLDALGRVVVSDSASHSVRVFAANAHGNSRPIHTVTGVGPDSGSPSAIAVSGASPSAPTSVHAQVHGDRATVHWTAPATTGGGIEGYVIAVIQAGPGGYGFSFAFISGPGGLGLSTKTSGTVGHLATGRKIRFAVIAINNFGFSPFGESNKVVAFAPPGPPTDLIAVATSGAMTVGWHPPAESGGKPITRYRVEYGTCTPGAKGCRYRSLTVPGGTHQVRIKGLAASRTYHVRVLAQSRIGRSKPSQPVKVRT